MTEPYELPQRPKTDAWIERVRAADAMAEVAWGDSLHQYDSDKPTRCVYLALLAIASELRAQRIARRPGAGQ